MKLAIVITTINGPTHGFMLHWLQYSKDHNVPLIIVADAKTPAAEWRELNHPLLTFLGMKEQLDRFFDIAIQMPVNCYSRKAIGYLAAAAMDCTHVFESDDDNIVHDDFNFLDWVGRPVFVEVRSTRPVSGWINYFEEFRTSGPFIWPRGCPFRTRSNYRLELEQPAHPRIWQFNCMGEPDIDAAQRLEWKRTQHEPWGWSPDAVPFVLGENCKSPTNTQATLLDLSLLEELYIPCTCTHRFTDILRGWLWCKTLPAHTIAFGPTQVLQTRNDHNLYDDLMSELDIYRSFECVDRLSDDTETSLHLLYSKFGVVGSRETTIYRSWLREVAKCQK